MSTPKSFKLQQFRKWARDAHYEDVFVYHREPYPREDEVFAYARKLHQAGMVFLFSRRLDAERFEKCARRTPVISHTALDKVSAAIKVDPSTAYLDEKVDAA
jgi:hypothetical protein